MSQKFKVRMGLPAPAPESGDAVWGEITGTLSAQTDLQTALDGKENSLGNPTTNGYVLASQTDGTRSWVAQSGGGGTWGSITGTLSDQTDLQTALDSKLNTAAESSASVKGGVYYDYDETTGTVTISPTPIT